MAIPTRILEQINNSELNAADFYEKYGRQEVETELEKLRNSDHQILNRYKVEDMHRKIEEKIHGKKRMPETRTIQFAAAAAIFCTIFIPASMRLRSENSEIKLNNPIGVISTAETGTKKSTSESKPVRVKGNAKIDAANQNPKINLYRQNGNKVQALNDGSFAKSGDVIQITYNAGNEEYGVIFSVDGNGNITRHFPENSWHAEPLTHKQDETPLNFSYELDNAPDFECFIMVTSKKQFELNNLEQKIKNKTDIDYLKSLSYLPKKTDGITFVLEK